MDQAQRRREKEDGPGSEKEREGGWARPRGGERRRMDQAQRRREKEDVPGSEAEREGGLEDRRRTAQVRARGHEQNVYGGERARARERDAGCVGMAGEGARRTSMARDGTTSTTMRGSSYVAIYSVRH